MQPPLNEYVSDATAVVAAPDDDADNGDSIKHAVLKCN